jgi:DNA-binding transcriptional ArsR family regulator
MYCYGRVESLLSKPKVSKRLDRLIKSGICSGEDVEQYSEELRQLAEKIADKGVANRRSRLFKALADETRLRILALLGVREMCVCEVMVALGLTQPTASHHLGILGNAGLISERKEGKWVFYRVADSKLAETIHSLNA